MNPFLAFVLGLFDADPCWDEVKLASLLAAGNLANWNDYRSVAEQTLLTLVGDQKIAMGEDRWYRKL